MLVRRLLALLLAVVLVLAAMEVRARMFDEATLLDRLTTGAEHHLAQLV